MAFPDDAVLIDDFNRANGALGANWSAGYLGSGSGMTITSNQIHTGGSDTAYHDSYYNAADFGPDVQAYMDISQKPSTEPREFRIYARLVSAGTAGADGYRVRVSAESGTDVVNIQVVTNGVGTTLGAAISQEFSNGDKIGIECIGDQISAYRHNGSSWSLLGTRTDSTYGGAGKCVIQANNTTWIFDNFYAGTVSGGGDPEHVPGSLALLGVGRSV